MSKSSKAGFLQNTRVYLSGPMDFVASRAEEKKFGWRVRVGEFLRSFGATVFDPWNKPSVRGLHEYGQEDVATTQLRENWTFEMTERGSCFRAECAETFWETMHIDLRMVDVSDFVIAFCPTNIYSVGTPHEIITARQQHKPVLFVSRPVNLTALNDLQEHLHRRRDRDGKKLLDQLIDQVPIKSNPSGVPSLWYVPLIGENNFFDGFGFADYRKRFNWTRGPSDEHENLFPPKRPLLTFLTKLNETLPQKWSPQKRKMVHDDNWLLLEASKSDKS